MTKIDVEKLRWELEKELGTDDKLLILNVCERCENKTISINRPESWIGDEATFNIV